MRVLIAGGTGVLGRALVPRLVEAGHDAVILARSSRREAIATAAGATFVQADALDRKRLAEAVKQAQPDIIVNFLTAIPDEPDPKRMAEQFETTNRLRTSGTRNLIEAAQSAGWPKLISESVAFAYAPNGDRIVAEDVPLWHDGPAPFRPIVAAIEELERQTLEVEGIVLRFGLLYGPGTVYAPDGSTTAMIRQGKLPVVGRGSAILSFLHTDDAARAVVHALDHDGPGTFNIVDHEPVEMRSWLRTYAEMIGAPRPKRVPALLARTMIGPWGVALMNQMVGASNDRAIRVLGWEPERPSWRAMADETSN